jgi:YidC/Oxa1 family membrane protein insertase
MQMPIWFALFSVLREPGKWVSAGSDLATAVAAGKLDFLWMNLSLKPSESLKIGIVDAIPYFLTIIMVVFTAYWQQRQTMTRNPTPGQQQPGQAIMKIFPLFFGFISFNLPAGLVVYFAASQIFRIGQQALILGMDGHPKKADAPPKGRAHDDTTPPRASQGSPGMATPSLGDTRRSPHVSKKKRGKKRRRK